MDLIRLGSGFDTAVRSSDHIFQVLDRRVPRYTCLQIGLQARLGKPRQNILRDVLLLLMHEPVTSTLVVDDFGLREEFLDQTNASLRARTVSSPTEEEDRDLDRISHREVAG